MSEGINERNKIKNERRIDEMKTVLYYIYNYISKLL